LDSDIKTDEMPKFMKVDQVANILGISKATAFNLARKPGFPAVRIGEKRIVVPTDKFFEWIDEEARKPLEEYSLS